MLASGQLAFAANAHLAKGPIYHAREAVQPGQRVRVRVGGARTTRRGTLAVSLRPFAPDPWARLAEAYTPQMNVEGVVVELRGYGALVELLPGASGLLPNAHIAPEYVVHPGDYLSVNDRVVVCLLTLQPELRKAELSLVDADEDAAVEPPASIYPDGPPWLTELSPDDSAEVQAAEDAPVEECRTAEEPPPHDEVPLAYELGTPADQSVPSVDTRGTLAGDRDLLAGGPDCGAAGPSDLGDVAELAEAVAAGAALQARVEALVVSGERELARLRVRARELTAQLRDEIAAAEQRILRLEEHEAADLIVQARGEIEVIRGETDELRERLAAAEQDREQLIRQERAARERSERASRQAEEARRDAESARSQAETLRSQLEVIDGGDPAHQFTRELHHAWAQQYATDEDRRRWQFRRHRSPRPGGRRDRLARQPAGEDAVGAPAALLAAARRPRRALEDRPARRLHDHVATIRQHDDRAARHRLRTGPRALLDSSERDSDRRERCRRSILIALASCSPPAPRCSVHCCSFSLSCTEAPSASEAAVATRARRSSRHDRRCPPRRLPRCAPTGGGIRFRSR